MITICELREKYSLEQLLRIANLARPTFFYIVKHQGDKENRERAIKEKISTIFRKNHDKYGYIRITYKLREEGYCINKKKVYRLMKELGLQANKRVKKYKSYRGECGLVAPNLMNQTFETELPYQKLGTDVTMFVTKFGRLYLSPIIDFNSREVLSYDLSETPDYGQIRRMLNQLYTQHGTSIHGSILQSDQGYLYQLGAYQRLVKRMGIVQSMSRKGNCLDNSPTENFFGRLKTEMFYGKEGRFVSMQHLKEAIAAYIDYYNEERIVNKLMTSPIKYRKKVMATRG